MVHGQDQSLQHLAVFLRDFANLTEKQLQEIRRSMTETVSQVMESVNKINRVAEEKKSQAVEVLVIEGEAFKTINAETLKIKENSAEIENPEKIRQNLQSQLMRTAGLLSKHIEAVCNLESAVSDVVMDTIGILSTGDVMTQRVAHVISSFNLVKLESLKFIAEHNSADREEFKSLRNRVLSKVYTTYTMQEERDIFHQVFGLPERPAVRAS